MKWRSVAALASTALLAMPVSVFAADDSPRRTPVYLESTAKEIYGRQFIYHIRELLRGSRGLALAPSEGEAAYQIRIVAIDDDPHGIAYSVVWTLRNEKTLPTYVNQSVGTCGRNVLESCAQTIVAATDERIQEDAKAWADFLKDVPKTNATQH